MTGWVDIIGDLAVETIRAPRAAARRIIALDLPTEARWTGLLLVAVLALLETRLAVVMMPGYDAGPIFGVVANPWYGIPVQVLSLLLIAGCMAVVGRIFGGTGNFLDALVLVIWLEFLLTLAQALQLLALLIFPPLGALIAFAALGLFLWLLAQFTAALHGFKDLARCSSAWWRASSSS